MAKQNEKKVSASDAATSAVSVAGSTMVTFGTVPTGGAQFVMTQDELMQIASAGSKVGISRAQILRGEYLVMFSHVSSELRSYFAEVSASQGAREYIAQGPNQGTNPIRLAFQNVIKYCGNEFGGFIESSESGTKLSDAAGFFNVKNEAYALTMQRWAEQWNSDQSMAGQVDQAFIEFTKAYYAWLTGGTVTPNGLGAFLNTQTNFYVDSQGNYRNTPSAGTISLREYLHSLTADRKKPAAQIFNAMTRKVVDGHFTFVKALNVTDNAAKEWDAERMSNELTAWNQLGGLRMGSGLGFFTKSIFSQLELNEEGRVTNESYRLWKLEIGTERIDRDKALKENATNAKITQERYKHFAPVSSAEYAEYTTGDDAIEIPKIPEVSVHSVPEEQLTIEEQTLNLLKDVSSQLKGFAVPQVQQVPAAEQE